MGFDGYNKGKLGGKMSETEKIGETLRTDTESIKLYKNSRGYNWEIKILSTDVKRLVELDIAMHKEFDVV